MRKVIFILVLLFAIIINSNAQGALCADVSPFCTDTTVNFPAGVDTPDAEPGNEYDCLFTQPNPAWYFLEISVGGDIMIDLSNSNNVDIDFILYGPWNNLLDATDDCGSFTASQVIDCSYSANAAEIANLTGAIPGEVYILLITNYSNAPTDIYALSSNSSTGESNCDILLPCFINPGTITDTECDESNGSVEGIIITGGDGNYSYSWTDPGNNIISNDLDIYDLEAGIYTLYVEDLSGCENSETFEIVNSSSLENASFEYQEENYCLSLNVNPVPDILGTPNGVFIANNGLSINSQTGEIYLSNSNAGNYEISYITTGNCSDTAVFDIELIDIPDTGFSYENYTYCPESQSVIPNFIASPNGTFSGNNMLNIDPQTGEFSIDENFADQQFQISYEINDGTCTNNTNVLIEVLDIPYLDFELAAEGCVNSKIDIIYTGNVNEGLLSWNLNESDISNEIMINNSLIFDATGNYNIELNADNNQCLTDPVSKSISIIELLIEVDSIYSIELGESVNLSFETNSNNEIINQWSPDYNITCTNCLQPLVNPFVNTIYNLNVIDAATGCSANRTIAIKVNFQKPYLPNIFSPNDNSINDIFIPIGDFAGFMEFNIFNRWGEKVFYTNDPKKGWKGNYKNYYRMNSGVYVWTLEYEIPNGDIFFDKGTVTLIK